MLDLSLSLSHPDAIIQPLSLCPVLSVGVGAPWGAVFFVEAREYGECNTREKGAEGTGKTCTAGSKERAVLVHGMLSVVESHQATLNPNVTAVVKFRSLPPTWQAWPGWDDEKCKYCPSLQVDIFYKYRDVMVRDYNGVQSMSTDSLHFDILTPRVPYAYYSVPHAPFENNRRGQLESRGHRPAASSQALSSLLGHQRGRS